ncbi:HindIII family type II restriction endonuclease [Selenomonas sp. AE3005]|uniref:HindIII family type II restriction endonuclease n=1 Tax=Selenomonas sp. AE3005 TaxID=1485543 RepID=UPI000488E742|nr:HindIII family type II restriction endonuclease [Selenomonas sp. AE3005]
MNSNNIFFFKNIVDSYYPDEKRPSVDISSVVNETAVSLKEISDSDFEEIMISCFIPDLYSGMGKSEKLFTKLTELMVGEWWRRIGGTYNLPTKKSGTEDVELIKDDISIVCDAKVFRLGRSQKAPNVKDFLKLASVKLWIDNLNKKYLKTNSKHTVIGGLVTYSSLHEWENDSEVYEECTNLDIPVVMFPYEILALLLKYKNNYSIKELNGLWSYRENRVNTSRNKASYWRYIKKYVCTLISINSQQYDSEIKEYHSRIISAIAEYRKIVESTIIETEKNISTEMEQFKTIDELKEYALKMIISRDNCQAIEYLKHIDEFRTYKDLD